MNEFRTELTDLLNKHNMDVVTGTPDFILAELLLDTLMFFGNAVKNREEWFGR